MPTEYDVAMQATESSKEDAIGMLNGNKSERQRYEAALRKDKRLEKGFCVYCSQPVEEQRQANPQLEDACAACAHLRPRVNPPPNTTLRFGRRRRR